MNLQPKHFRTSLHPLGPMVVFSYGMTKCGSTLAFETARTALARAGFEQPVLSPSTGSKDSRINFFGHIDAAQMKNLVGEVREIGHPIVIKTHSRPDPCVIDLINAGGAIAQATYRDPRDMALSMMDHGAKNRGRGEKPFAEITDLLSACDNIRSQIDTLTQWLYRPNCLPIYYTDIAFKPVPITRRILSHLQLQIPARPLIKHAHERRFTQFNKGLKDRYKSEMSRKDSRAVRSHFETYYKHLITNRKTLGVPPKPPLSEDVVLVKTSG